MPTPVTVARQCLTPDAVQALDEAVSVARRRGHAQTTSLHAVSALLSLPSSTLREACARARNCAYSPRLQFKALELCLSVSLDRVSSSQLTEDPPVSNSLMAAIKRSQANQRRQPENFHLYHHLPHVPPHSSSSSSSASSVAIVKVELQHLILSILDDPVVSRVFSEAGFRSSEIKLAIVRPLQSHLYKFPRSRAPPPPIFLYNYPGENPDPVPGRRSLGGFAFPGFGGFLGGDDESRRIGEVLVKRKKNPLLLGVCADAALRTFRESVEENNKSINKSNDNIKKNTSVLPAELSGLDVVSIENDISRFIVENGDDKSLSVRFEEVGRLVEQNLGPGVVVNYGDLKVFVDGDDDVKNDNNGDDNGGCGKSDAASLVVAHLTRLVQLYGVKVWLIGAAATYETYSKFVSRFPSIDKDWNLELLPITSLRPAAMAGSFPKSSLMESFVPFGGFFSTPSDFKNPLNGMFQGVSRCHQCNEKCEQEIASFSKGGSSITDQYQSSLPSWLQMAESGVNKGLDVEAKDDRRALSAKVTEVQKKWDDLCRTLHHNQPFPNPSIYQVGSQFPTVMGFRFLEDKKETANNSISTTKAPPNENNCVNVNSGIPIDLENVSASNSALPFSTVSKCKNESFLSKLLEKPLKADAESGGLRSTCSLSNSSVGDGSQTSPTSVTSVTTDLGLGLSSAPTSSDLKKRIDEDHADFSPQLSGCFSANVDIVNDYLPAQSSSSSCPELHRPFDLSNFKMLCSALSERVGWQDEAIGMISQCIVNRRKGNENCHGARADIWFNFAGPDRSGKRKIAIALAEILYGSKENLICADLSSQDGVINTDPIFSDQDASGYCLEFRGKTPVDYVAGELCQKPLSVVFLENVDKADLQARNSLSKAIQSGKFSDSHGREVSISNAIFVTTSALTKDCKIMSSCTYSEERILRAKSRPIRIQIEPVLGKSTNSQITRRKDISNPNPILVNKRKLTGTNEYPEKHDVSEIVKRAHRSPNRNLDLNLPAEGDELKDTDDGSSDNDSFESSKSWLQNFYDQPVETVVFKQFDFDTLAKKFFEDINKSFHKVVGPICLLEVDSKVMEQLLAAAYLSNRNRVVEDWLENVLSMEFVQVRKRYNLTSHSIVKLITCLDCFPEEQTPGVCFPPKIVMN